MLTGASKVSKVLGEFSDFLQMGRPGKTRFFFLFIHYSHATYQIMARLYTTTVRFLSAARAVAARCKHPFAPRAGLSQEDVMRTKEITKERKSERARQT